MARKMKDSGVEWIGMIPDGWNTFSAFQIFSRVDCKNVGMKERNLLSLSYGKIKRKDIESTDGLLPESFEGYNIIEAGDVVLRLTDLQNDQKSLRVGYSRERGIVTSAYLTIRNNSDNVPEYLYYYWHTFDVCKGFYGLGAGVRQGLNWEGLKNLRIALPPPSVQNKIVELLNKQCASIDDVIAKTNESIEEYKKLKQAVITEAVTKGVRGKRPMKASDIDWIDEIPKDWNTDKLKRILTERMENNDPVQTSERLSLSIDTGVTLYAEKTTNLDRFKEDVSQYKLAHEGDLVMNSMNVIVGAVGISNYFGCISPAYYTYYDNEPDHVTARYMDYVFRTKSLRALLYRLGKGIYAIDRGDGKVNTCRLKVSREDMRSLKLPLPSVEEQREIVQYLDKKRVDIDTLISKKQQFIDELTAYKKSLIYEYVTGKKEVPA